MAESSDLSRIEGTGFSLELDSQLHAASLRYFERGAFTRLAESITHLSLPGTGAATCRTGVDTDSVAAGSTTLLAWRSPSETTLLTTEPELIDALQSAAVALSDGTLVDQRGGILVFRARGIETANLVARTAGHGAMPAIGESRRTRLAEVAVLLVKVRAEECLLIVDRIFAPHVMASIRLSAADLENPLYD